MKDIVSYKNYRTFLQDLVKYKKENDPSFSINKLAEKACISKSLLKMVLIGERKLSCESLLKITSALNFSFEEKVFLEALMQENQAKTKDEKDFHSKRKQKVKEEVTVKNIVVNKKFPFNKWYYPALILYLIDIEDVAKKGLENLDRPRISEIFAISQADLEEDIQLFQEQKLLLYRADGKYHLCLDNLGSAFKRQNFIFKVLEKSMERLTNSFENKKNYFSVDTISIETDQIENFKQDYQKMISNYIGKDFNENSSVKIMQLALQMFTVN